MTRLTVAPTAENIAEVGASSRAVPGTLTTEVVVVGTGAGGAAAGRALARAGKRVTFLEEGDAFPRAALQQKSLRWSLAHLYAQQSPHVSTGDVRMAIPTGCTVGGSTVLNSGICFRPPASRLREWASRVGDDRLGPEHLAPYVEDVWVRLGVSPTHEGIGRRNNALLARGMARVHGIRHGWMDRSAPGCIGCGVCHLGCPSGGKASVDRAVLPEAVNHGALIVTGARVEAVVVEGGRATGVVAAVLEPFDTPDAQGKPRRKVGVLHVKADVVILAGNALYSPLILEASGVGGPERGRHLAVHPGIGVFGELDEPVHMWSGVPQGYFAEVPDDDHALVETASLGPTEMFSVFARAGAGGLDTVARMAHIAMAGTMIRDEGGGTVERGEDGAPIVAIRCTPRDLAAWRAGTKLIVRAFFAAGARRVALGYGPPVFHETEEAALRAAEGLRTGADITSPYGSHPQGTCRMGPAEGPYRGVVDANAQVHGTRGLYVMDGSIFPTTLGVNPQVTIMALATMLADRLAA